MATSVSADSINFAGDISSPGIAFDIEVDECGVGATFSVPKRVRRRLEQSPENKAPASLEEIEARLKEADYRRQQFHVWLANKARPKRKLDQTTSPMPKELAERLEARLCAAEQKRLEMLAQDQMRLARLNESRVAAKTEAQLRAEREREELGSKVEFRVQQAETNRLALIEAEKQRRAAANERMAQSVLQRTNLEDKDRERTEALRVAIGQKIAAAEEKRACLLEAEKSRAQANVMQARKVAEAVLRERQAEVMNKKERLEARMLRAKRQRAEYLRQKGGCRGACHNHGHKMNKYGDRLCRKLTSCWRQFRRSMKTTYILAQEFAASGIDQRSVTSLPFDGLAARITSPAALKSVKALLARIESRLMLSAATESSEIPNINSLLKRLAPTPRKNVGKRGSSQAAKAREAAKAKEAKPEEHSLERYPARVFLCAYMIFGHPDAVFSSKGDRETALAEAAAKLLPEFEALVSTVIDGPTPSSPPSSPIPAEGQHKPFAAQLASFDTAWHSYLCRFVAWKVQDAQLLEEDLIRVACQLEVSMLHKCRVGEPSALTHDAEAIRKQVLEDQRLLREKIASLTGKAGLDKMKEALVAAREKFLEAKENGVALPSPFAYSSPQDLKTVPETGNSLKSERFKPKAARSLFTSPAPMSSSSPEIMNLDSGAELHNSGITNEQIVNKMLLDGSWKQSEHANCNLAKIEAQIRTTMEKAFWDNIEEGLLNDVPDYRQVVSLVGEIREGLESIAPESWKQGVRESLDLELLSQVLESGINDFEHLRRLLDYTLDVIMRLGMPERDKESKSARDTLIEELSKASTDGNTKEAFAKAVVKGIRFVFEQLQVLKQDCSNYHMEMFSKHINGTAGVDYLQKAFSERYSMTPSISEQQLREKLPRAVKWLRDIQSTVEVQKAEVEAAMSMLQVPNALPPTFPMCTGGRVVVTGPSASNKPKAAVTGGDDLKMGSLSWESTDALVRLGLLAVISSPEAATDNSVAETLTLNVGSLRDCQNDFQTIAVIATGLLLVRQELMTKVQGPELETMISEASKEMRTLLTDPAASMAQIGTFLAQVCAKNCSEQYPDVNACVEFMTRVLGRYLSPGDPVFGRVTAAVRSSLRGVLLVGNGPEGVGLAESVLKRIGGGVLVEPVVSLARKLDKIANITVQVHGSWYKRML